MSSFPDRVSPEPQPGSRREHRDLWVPGAIIGGIIGAEIGLIGALEEVEHSGYDHISTLHFWLGTSAMGASTLLFATGGALIAKKLQNRVDRNQ